VALDAVAHFATAVPTTGRDGWIAIRRDRHNPSLSAKSKRGLSAPFLFGAVTRVRTLRFDNATSSERRIGRRRALCDGGPDYREGWLDRHKARQTQSLSLRQIKTGAQRPVFRSTQGDRYL